MQAEPFVVRAHPCRVETCTKGTAEGKPYCIDHLDLLPYVAKLRQGVEQRDRELAAAERGEVAVDSSIAADLLEWMRENPGAKPTADVARAVGMPLPTTESLLDALRRAGFVERFIHRDRKHSTVLSFWNATTKEHARPAAAERTASVAPKRETRTCGCGFVSDWPPAFGSHVTKCEVARAETLPLRSQQSQRTESPAKRSEPARKRSESAVDTAPRRSRSVASAEPEGNGEGTAVATSTPRTPSDEEVVAERVREAVPEMTQDAEAAFSSYAKHVRVCRARPTITSSTSSVPSAPRSRAAGHVWNARREGGAAARALYAVRREG